MHYILGKDNCFNIKPMLFDTFYSWGHSNREIARMTLAPATDPKRFNSNYIKTQRKVHVPVPDASPPTLPSKGSNEWGQLVAKAVVPVSTNTAFNRNYLKPDPENLRHIPPPRLYTKEGALAQLQGATAPAEAKVEITPIDKATRIRDAQVDGSNLETYWNGIIVSLTQIKNTQAMRPLTSQELEVERGILQRIKDYELDPANELKDPGPAPVGGPGSSQQIQDAIAALANPPVKVQPPATPVKVQSPATPVKVQSPATPVKPGQPTQFLHGKKMSSARQFVEDALTKKKISQQTHNKLMKVMKNISVELKEIEKDQTDANSQNELDTANLQMDALNGVAKQFLEGDMTKIAGIPTPQKVSPPSKSASLNELRNYIAINKLNVSSQVGGASKRTKDDIYADIMKALP